jgi:hypothetical protein
MGEKEKGRRGEGKARRRLGDMFYLFTFVFETQIV